ncbi:MAG TPA: hypothetical protein VKB19_18375 [Pedobacter sp.]|nr:hypothetical protein [Pedobacter sp.]
MASYKVTVDSATRASLGNIRSSFLELAFERFLYTKDRLQHEQNKAVRLLLLKEVFSIFDEINAIIDVRVNFNDPQAFDSLFELVNFLRNVLLHFPLFDTWDQIFISPSIGSEMMPQRKGGQIAKYLNNNLGKADVPYTIQFSSVTFDASINLSAIKADPDFTFLKDIVSEKDVITLIVELIQHLYTAKKQNP